MRLRTPPGRSGRLWLRHRLEIAERATDLLDYKRRELSSELSRLSAVVRRTRSDLDEALSAASLASAAIDEAVATCFVGTAAAFEAPARLEVEWRAVMGVRYPTRASVTFDPPARVSMLPGGAALAAARDAHRRALEAAVAAAAAEAAHGRVLSEWEATTRSARALELRAIPAHEDALAALELRLDEREREDGMRVRWASGRVPSVGGRDHD